jgi:hypothetical protein
MGYLTGFSLIALGAALAYWGGLAISKRGTASADPRIWLGSLILGIGFVVLVVSALAEPFDN